MSKNERLPDELLHAWMDGEAGKRTSEVRDLVAKDPAAAAQVAEWRDAARKLNELVDAGVGDVDALQASSKIRQRIVAHAQASLAARFGRWWDELWAYHRKAVVGALAAAALGALCAPGVVWLLRERVAPVAGGATTASIVVESLEVGGNAKAVVMQADSGTTTLIWVEPAGNGKHAEEF